MNEGSAPVVRLSIGTFQTPRALDGALVELMDAGLSVTTLSLVGTCQAFMTLVRRSNHANSEIWRPLREQSLLPLYIGPNELALFMTPGAIQKTLQQHDRADPLEAGLLDAFESTGGLVRRLHQHALAVMAMPPSPGLHQRSSRILLRHSQDTVQTHEFTFGKSALP